LRAIVFDFAWVGRGGSLRIAYRARAKIPVEKAASIRYLRKRFPESAQKQSMNAQGSLVGEGVSVVC
jgi:hypothetical protein